MYALHDFPVQLPNDNLKGLLFPQDITDIGFFFLDQFSILPANENWHYWSRTLDRLSGEHPLQPEELANDHKYLYLYVETSVLGPNFPKTQTAEIQCLLYIPIDFLTKTHTVTEVQSPMKLLWTYSWDFYLTSRFRKLFSPFLDWKSLAFCCY